MLQLVALTSTSESGDQLARSLFPLPLSSAGAPSKAARSAAPAFRVDTENDVEAPPEMTEMARARGYRSILAVPMLREGVAIGTINVTRKSGIIHRSPDQLLQTFADQAVIAIENVRLFNETKKRWSADGDRGNLKVIASSPSDVQPVFDAIVASAVRL